MGSTASINRNMGQESSKPLSVDAAPRCHSELEHRAHRGTTKPYLHQHPHGPIPPVNIPPPETNEPYDDWSQTLEFTPKEVHKPKTVQEIYDILNIKDSKEVSVIASGHSCSRLWINTTIITLDFMQKVFEDVPAAGQPAFSTVRVSANMDLRDCLKRLAEHQRTLPGTGGVDEQQLGGLLGTFTAPASKELTIYDGVISIEYVTKDKVNNVAEGELLKVLKGNLGLVGVVTHITLCTRPNIGMKAIQRIVNVKDMSKLMEEGKNFVYDDKDDPEADGKEYPFWRYDCMPGLNKSKDREIKGYAPSWKALLWAARKVDVVEEPNYDPAGDYVDQYKNMPMSMRLFTFIQKQSIYRYKFDPYNDIITATSLLVMQHLISGDTNGNTFYGPLRNMLPVDRFLNKDVTCAMAEWAFKPSLIQDILHIYEEYFNEFQWPNLPIEVEYVKCDDSYMSPWNSSEMKDGPMDHLVKVNTMWFYSKSFFDPEDEQIKPRSSDDQAAMRKMIEDHAEGLWKKLKGAGISFKAHWGKINFKTPKDVEELYEWEKFKDYIQPQMMNDYYQKRLPQLSSF